MVELCDAGRSTEAIRASAEFPFNDDDIAVAVAEDAGYFEAVGRYVPNLLNVQQQAMEYEGPTPDAPAVLGAISAPVLVLYGSHAKPHDLAAARHVTDHVRDARTQAITGAGHAAPLTHPDALAEALAEFFTSARQPVWPVGHLASRDRPCAAQDSYGRWRSAPKRTHDGDAHALDSQAGSR